MKEHGIEAPEVKSFDLNNEKVWFKNTYRQVKVQLVNGFVKRMRYFRHTLGKYLLLFRIQHCGHIIWIICIYYIIENSFVHMYMILVSEPLSKLEFLFDNLIVSLIRGRLLDKLFELVLLIFALFYVIKVIYCYYRWLKIKRYPLSYFPYPLTSSYLDNFMFNHLKWN